MVVAPIWQPWYVQESLCRNSNIHYAETHRRNMWISVLQPLLTVQKVKGISMVLLMQQSCRHACTEKCKQSVKLCSNVLNLCSQDGLQIDILLFMAQRVYKNPSLHNRTKKNTFFVEATRRFSRCIKRKEIVHYLVRGVCDEWVSLIISDRKMSWVITCYRFIY